MGLPGADEKATGFINRSPQPADLLFLPVLEALKTHPEILADGYFSSVLADAITACGGGSNT